MRRTLPLLLVVLLAGCTARPVPLVGHAAPDFTLADIDGVPFHLKAARGQPVLLELFGVHCDSCRAMEPQLLQYRATFGADQATMVSVDLGDRFDGLGAHNASEVRAWRDEHGAAWIHIFDDANHTVATHYPVPARPTIYLLDREGTMSVVHGGYVAFETLRDETRRLP